MKRGVSLHRDTPRRGSPYSPLYRKFILTALICSLLPLLLVGWGIHIHYARFARDRMLNAFQERVEHHRKVIEMFLEERRSRLQVIADTHSVDILRSQKKLSSILEILNQGDDSYADLGVIDEQGRHLAYVGPYDLMEKNYAQAFWFRPVLERGIYISALTLLFASLVTTRYMVNLIKNRDREADQMNQQLQQASKMASSARGKVRRNRPVEAPGHGHGKDRVDRNL